MSATVRIGIIGGGLMGREVAAALGRWFVLEDYPVKAELVAVCDLMAKQRDWFKQVPTVKLITAEYRELIRSPDVDVVYVAVPHNLHEAIYVDVLRAGKDLFAEKPFGVDLQAARNIAAAAEKSGRFVRCSSEFPFLPGPQRAFQIASAGGLGKMLEVRSGFHHGSDLDPTKPTFPSGSGGSRSGSTRNCRRSITSGPTARAARPFATRGTTRCFTPISKSTALKFPCASR
jgi:predicted dehydrogenase